LAEKEFVPDDQWELFFEKFIEFDGNQTKAAEAAGMSVGLVSHKKKNKTFREWLKAARDGALLTSELKADAQLGNAVNTGKPLDPEVRKDIKLLYERLGKIDHRINVDQSTHYHQGEALSPKEINELIDWKVEQQLIAQKN